MTGTARRRGRSAIGTPGDLATIGRKAAVVKLGRLELTGFIGWLFWSVVHIYFLIGLRNRFVVAATWLWSYLTYKRGARLISPDWRPSQRLKRDDFTLLRHPALASSAER